MARLIYSAITSLDGYVADESGRFDWAEPDEAVHTFINDLERPIGTYLYGRRMYEVMAAWETLGTDGEQPAYIRDFGRIWRAADKIVYSTTLDAVCIARTRIEREFEPDAIRRMKDEVGGDVSIGGPRPGAGGSGDHGRSGRWVPADRRARGRRRGHAVSAGWNPGLTFSSSTNACSTTARCTDQTERLTVTGMRSSTTAARRAPAAGARTGGASPGRSRRASCSTRPPILIRRPPSARSMR